jgi:hypothetical protein
MDQRAREIRYHCRQRLVDVGDLLRMAVKPAGVEQSWESENINGLFKKGKD